MLIAVKSSLYNSMETELAQAVDVMLARAKRIYILIITLVVFLFSSQCFLKEIENMHSIFPSNIIIETLVKVWEN